MPDIYLDGNESIDKSIKAIKKRLGLLSTAIENSGNMRAHIEQSIRIINLYADNIEFVNKAITPNK